MSTYHKTSYLRSRTSLALVAASTLLCTTEVLATQIQFTGLSNNDDLVNAGFDGADGGGDASYGTASSTGIANFNTPNVTVLWGSFDPTPGNNAADNWKVETPFSFPSDHVYFHGNETAPSTSTLVTFTAASGFKTLLQSMNVGGLGAGRPFTLEVIVDGVTTSSSIVAPTNSYLNVDTSATGFGQVVSFRLIGQTIAASQVVVDDITFTQQAVPEPSGIILFCVGLIGLVCRTRRSLFRINAH